MLDMKNEAKHADILKEVVSYLTRKESGIWWGPIDNRKAEMSLDVRKSTTRLPICLGTIGTVLLSFSRYVCTLNSLIFLYIYNFLSLLGRLEDIIHLLITGSWHSSLFPKFT